MLPEDRHGLFDEAFEDALIEEGAVHGGGVVAWEKAVAEFGEDEEGLCFGGVTSRAYQYLHGR